MGYTHQATRANIQPNVLPQGQQPQYQDYQGQELRYLGNHYEPQAYDEPYPPEEYEPPLKYHPGGQGQGQEQGGYRQGAYN